MAFYTNWQRLLRRTLRVVASLLILILLAWLGLAWYVNTHKKEILAEVSTGMSERIRGDLQIKSMELSMFHSFPNVALTLKDVTIQDSLWPVHRHSLLEAGEVYVRVNPFALLGNRLELQKITAAHGQIFFYADSTGYSNTYLVSRNDSSRNKRSTTFDKFGLEDMHLWYVNDMKQKLYHLHFKQLDGTIRQLGNEMKIRVNAFARVHEFNFNITRGSFIKDQDIRFDFSMTYKMDDKHLYIPEQDLTIGRYDIQFGGDFYFNKNPPAFAIMLRGKDIPYNTALSWVSPNIQKVMRNYDFEKPVSMNVSVSGLMKFRTIPLIRIIYTIKDNTLITPLGNIDNLSYTGEYFNETVIGSGHGDNNSRIGMFDVEGEWRGLPFKSDTLVVSNLLRPIVKARIQSSFPVAALNDVIGGSVMSFDRGKAEADIRFDGGILPTDTTPHSINGFLKVSDAGFTYQPRNVVFNNANATLLFSGDNLLFRDVTLRSRNSSVAMEGDALNFLRLYFADPGKVSVAWRVRSPMVNLNDFTGFIGKRKSARPQSRGKTNAVSRIGQQLDRVLDEGTFALDARFERLQYKSFQAEAVVAKFTLAQRGIFLEQVHLRNGEGSLNIAGTIDQTAANNPFRIRSQIRNVDVARLFRSFNNFGQTAIGAENLAGRISSDADISGQVTDAGTILRNSFDGKVSFSLVNGELNQFSPFEKVGKFAFKKRNLSAVRIKDLKGKFDINGSKILIPPMEIQTSAINMNVQGVYGLGGGTDIYMEVPLRNPEKEGANTPIGMILRTGKGIVLHLRAQDTDGTGVKVGWDPRKKGKKATNEKLEIAD
jgi:hypothetical protein